MIDAIVAQVIVELEKLGGTLDEAPALGLATPGPASLDGVLHMTPNLKAELWDQFPIRAELEKALRKHNSEIRVRYIGDGQAAALGEYAVRSHRFTFDKIPADSIPDEELNSLFMVIVGTGLGGGMVIDGKPIQGLGGRAGHAGHILLPAFAFRHEHDRQLKIGNTTCCAESAVSLSALAHQIAYRLTLDEWVAGIGPAAGRGVFVDVHRLRELAADGDALALELFDEQARALGLVMHCANNLGDYDRLVIGGGVCDLAPAVRERYRKLAEEAYHQHALDGFRDLDRLEFSVCGDDAPVIGALAWATP